MGMFDFLRRRDEETPEPEEYAASDVLLSALIRGEDISKDMAMGLPAVNGAVDFISNTVASMPIKLYKRNGQKVDEQEDDPRPRLLNADTGDALDGFQMKKAMVTDFLLGKGGYCFIRRQRNTVTGLFYVAEENISFNENLNPIFKDYTIEVDGKTYRPYQFVKLLRNTTNGAFGKGLTETLTNVLQAAYQTILFQLGLVKNGGAKKGFLKTQRKLGQEEINVLKDAWRRMYSDNSENIVVLNNGLEFQEASSSPTELQVNENKRTFTDEINSLFHLYGDFETMFKQAIFPILTAFQTALNRDLLLEKEKGDYFFEFDTKEMLKASINERYAAYKTAKETGWMTQNEIRRAENLEDIDGFNVVNVGLGAVLYDIDKKVYFVPNTGKSATIDDAQSVQEEQKALMEAQLAKMQAEAQAKQETEKRYNHNHDPENGQFTTSEGGTSEGQINRLNKDGSITMTYVRVTGQKTKNYGETYGQNLEPAGEYMSMDTLEGKNKIQGYEYGTIKFKKPLILEWKSTGAEGWKKTLSEMYGGKTGKKLSNAIIKDGYDAVMTKDGEDFMEIVNLKGEKEV